MTTSSVTLLLGLLLGLAACSSGFVAAGPTGDLGTLGVSGLQGGLGGHLEMGAVWERNALELPPVLLRSKPDTFSIR